MFLFSLRVLSSFHLFWTAFNFWARRFCTQFWFAIFLQLFCCGALMCYICCIMRIEYIKFKQNTIANNRFDKLQQQQKLNWETFIVEFYLKDFVASIVLLVENSTSTIRKKNETEKWIEREGQKQMNTISSRKRVHNLFETFKLYVLVYEQFQFLFHFYWSYSLSSIKYAHTTLLFIHY